MAYLNAGSEFQNPEACHCLKQIDGRLPAVESNLIRLVVVELPDREVATSDIISDIRASYPNAQVMFTASQAAMAASAGGVGVVAASPSVTDQALMHGLNAMAQRSVVSAVNARGTMHDPGAMQDMEKARKLPNRRCGQAVSSASGSSGCGSRSRSVEQGDRQRAQPFGINREGLCCRNLQGIGCAQQGRSDRHYPQFIDSSTRVWHLIHTPNRAVSSS